MRCYKVTADVDNGDGENTIKVTKYVGTNIDMHKARQQIVDDHNIKKKDLEVEQVDIPTDKSGLLDFINNLVGG